MLGNPFTPAFKYPIISHEGQHVLVHRYMFEHINGSIPDDMFICHTCDNPRCHNPDHLYAGSPSQNAQDRHNRRRHPRQYDWVTYSQIFALREIARMNGTDIAATLGISEPGVNRILRKFGMTGPKTGRPKQKNTKNHVAQN